MEQDEINSTKIFKIPPHSKEQDGSSPKINLADACTQPLFSLSIPKGSDFLDQLYSRSLSSV